MGWFGHYAYIYTELDGDIPDGSVVSTWATIFDRDEKGDSHYETAECRVIFKSGRSFAPWSDIDIRTYVGEKNEGRYELVEEVTVWEGSSANIDSRYP